MSGKRVKMIYVAISVSLFVLFLILPGVSSIESFLYDCKVSLFSMLRHRSDSANPEFVLVNIDKPTLDSLRGTFGYGESAEVLKAARRSGARAVVLMYPPQGNAQNNSGRDEFISHLGEIPVLLSSYFQEDPTRSRTFQVVEPDKAFLRHAAGFGLVFPLPEDKLLTKRNIAVSWNDRYYPSIELALAAVLMEVPVSRIVYQRGKVFLGGKMVPTDGNYQVQLIPKSRKLLPSYSFNEIINSRDASLLKGKTLFVNWAPDSNQALVPGLPNRRESYQYTAASIAGSILTGNMVSPIPIWLSIIIQFSLILAVGYFLPQLKPELVLPVGLSVAFTSLAVNTGLFLTGYSMSGAALFLALAVYPLGVNYYRYRHSLTLTDMFVPIKLIRILQGGDPDADIQTVVRKSIVLFSDIKGYTTLSERHSPLVVMGMLKEYLTLMNSVVEEHGGVVLNYQGDSLMAVYGLDEGSEREAAYRAVETARDMQKAIEQLRRSWAMEGRELFIAGIGICAGDIALGVLGSDTFRQYTAIGDAVNEASRLQGLAKEMRIPTLMNDKAYMLVNDKVECFPVKPTRLKGKFNVSTVYRIDKPKQQKQVEVDTITGLSIQRKEAVRQKTLDVLRAVNHEY